jgi:hypothetical protein
MSSIGLKAASLPDRDADLPFGICVAQYVPSMIGLQGSPSARSGICNSTAMKALVATARATAEGVIAALRQLETM